MIARATVCHRLRAAALLLGTCLGASLLGGCVAHDDDLPATRDDFRQLTTPPPGALAPDPALAADEPPIPDLYLPLAAPPADPEIAPTRRVTVEVTEDVPLTEVFYELARQAEVDLEVDSRIQGGIIFQARNQPFLDVVRRMADLAGLRVVASDNRVRIEVDDPYIQDYSAPYLNLTRQGESVIGIDTGVATPGEGGQAAGETASRASLTGTTGSDVFAELQTTIATILATTRAAGLPPPPVIEGGGGGGGGTAAATSVPGVRIDRQAGLITVYGDSRQQAVVARYLEQMRRRLTQQVLIEARLIEVSLSDRYRSGINWTALFSSDFGFTANLTDFTLGDIPTNLSTFTFDTDDIDAVAQLVEGFGSTRTLSAPRVTVLSNNVAILKVADNQVFFELNVDREEATRDGQGDRITVDSEIRTVPIGLVLAVLPVVDLETDNITLNLRPTITRVTGTVDDPAVIAILQDVPNAPPIRSTIPIVAVREIDSTLRMRSGDVAVVGGLMQEEGQKDREGLPGLSESFLGPATSRIDEETTVTELVLLLRATIVEADETVAPADQRLYENYTRDPRPFTNF